jgi:hypothetical protein
MNHFRHVDTTGGVDLIYSIIFFAKRFFTFLFLKKPTYKKLKINPRL